MTSKRNFNDIADNFPNWCWEITTHKMYLIKRNVIKLSVAYARSVYSCRDPTMGQLLLNIHDIMFRNGVSSNLPLHDTSVKSGKW